MTKRPYEAYSSGKCPHCRLAAYFDSPVVPKGGSGYLYTSSAGDEIRIYSSRCPNCKKPIVTAEIKSGAKTHRRLVHPFNVTRAAPPEIPENIRDDFNEAVAVLPISEKASAALSRRCLQNLLRDKGHKQRDLNKQIDSALKELPTRIAENLDAIRQIGNYAAHPMKYKSTSLIVEVEPEESIWTLDVLEDLFDFYYVQPKRAAEKRKKLDAKLKSMGKPPLKKP